MTITDNWERQACEQVESLRVEREKFATDPERLVTFAYQNLVLVNFLSFVWKVRIFGFRNGGAPAARVIGQCDFLLASMAEPKEYLIGLGQGFDGAGLPAEAAGQILTDVKSALDRLDSLMEEVQKVRAWAAAPARISADPEEVERHIRKANAGNEWIRFREVLPQAQEGNGSPTQG